MEGEMNIEEIDIYMKKRILNIVGIKLQNLKKK